MISEATGLRKTKSLAYPPPSELPFLFEAGRAHEKGSKPQFYLLGTKHDIPKDLLAKSLEGLLSECDILVKEITGSTFGDASDVSVKDLKLHGLFSEQNPLWTEHFSKKARHYFEAHIKESINQAWHSEPHHISPVVVNHVISDWLLGGSYGEGMDVFIESRFREKGKPVFALENGQVRFDAYNTLFHLNNMSQEQSLKEQVFALEETILAWAESAKDEQSTRIRDKSDFDDYFSDHISTTCTFDQAEHLCKRNLLWVKTMETYLEQYPNKTILFIFGYAHLGGPYGILTLLKNLGLLVRKSSQNCFVT